MTTLREAAQLALDALHLWHWTKETTGFDAAHDALRDAILEPAPETVADTESDVLTATYMLGLHAGKKAAQRKPLTDESIGEVAIQDTQYHGYAMAIKPHIQGALDEGTKLYTSPPEPQRKPLTEEEIAALLSQSAGVDLKLNGGDLLFARAIERAHGIGGKE
jgi:hypothetical protein